MKFTSVPSVSIGIPVYNGALYINEAIDSLLAQSFSDFEIVISDNASTDGTAEICQQYADRDPRIRYTRQATNIGALENFKFVLREAIGGKFMWAAADDKWDKNWLDELVTAMERIGVGAAFGSVQSIDEKSDLLNHPANKTSFEYLGPTWWRRLRYFLQFEGGGKANPIYAVWRTADLRSINLDDYNFDYLIVFDMLMKTELIGCSNTKIYKRIHSSCLGGDASRNRLNSWERLYRLFNQFFVPVPPELTLGYLRYARENQILFFSAIPLKYVISYYFMIRNSRVFRRVA